MEDRRPAEYSVAPQYRPTVVESHLSKYVLEVDPLAFDASRASFSYRSPGLGTLQSSVVELCFDLELFNFAGQMGPNFQVIDAASTTCRGPNCSNRPKC